MTEQPGRPKYYRGAVAISGDRIALVSDSPQRIERYERERGEGLQVADGAGRLVMPGLINLHNHVSMTLMRGYADDLPLMPWLTEKIWPFEAKLDGDDIYSGAELGIAEMLLGTVFTGGLYFGNGSPVRQTNHGLNPAACCGKRYALRMVSRRTGNHAVCFFGICQLRNFKSGTANLKRTGYL